MERLHKLLYMQQYKQAQRMLEIYEENREYCKHGKDHCRDVARIAYMISLEEKLDIEKEIIYATAFLHDMGRIYEYQNVCSHESGSIIMAMNWLPECGFSKAEIREIVEAIKAHGKKGRIGDSSLGKVIQRADKLSRDCFCCQARSSCKWPKEMMNMQIRY